MRTSSLALLLIPLMICQCGSFLGKKIETRTVWESGGEYIRLFREVEAGRGYDQPVHFHEKDVRKILQSVYYAKYQFFRWSSSTRVFEKAEAKELAPHFQRAFMDAGPDDVVEFYLPRRAKKVLGASGQSYLTRGRAFVQGTTLHIRFDNVEQPIQGYATDSEYQKPLPPSSWKLVPQEGQSYGRESGTSGPGNENLHWLNIDLETEPTPSSKPKATIMAPAAVPVAAPSEAKKEAATEETPAAATSPAARAGAKERLRELKQMLNEGLITQDDYNRKKKEILDTL